MRNIAIRLRYDGTRYHGWQIQKEEATVQKEVENALSRITGESVHVTGCGRTDAGVHAERYCANFRTNAFIPTERLPYAINALLPLDICVSAAVAVEDDFNSILSCKRKEYTYRLLNTRIRDPFLENRVWQHPVTLDINVMREAASAFIGTHDFSAVRSVGTETKSSVRTVYYFDITKDHDLIEFKISANGFLYNMARAMVGTVVFTALGKISPDSIPSILAAGDRRLSGPTAPACGLYMTYVEYGGPVGEMMES